MKENKKIAAGIILHPSLHQIFIARRNPKANQGALWEFPGGKIELGETAEQAVIRELIEEIGIQATKIEHFMSLSHNYGDGNLDFDFFLIHSFTGVACGNEQQPTKWVKVEELANYAFPEANMPVISAVQAYFAAIQTAPV